MNVLKSSSLYRGCNPSVVDKSLHKFSKNKQVSTLNRIVTSSKQVIVFLFYSPLNYNMSKILSGFDFRILYKPVNKVRFPFPKGLIPLLIHREYTGVRLFSTLFFEVKRSTRQK